jgi:hypothetical protein
MTTKIKITELTLKDLVKEALTISDGWKEEIYTKNGYVTFSEPMTPSTHSGIDAYTPLPEYITDIESMSIDDFEEYHLRKDGKVEIAANTTDEDTEQGELYDKVYIYTYDEAIDFLVDEIENSGSTLNKILQKIQEMA